MSSRTDLLLRKALQSLDANERDELLGGLLLGQLSGGMPAAAGVVGPVALPRGAVNRDRLASLFGTEIPAPSAAGVRLKVLPVRLPEVEHGRLRQFCQASGFSMAVVIRALVERFLDQYAAGTDSPE
jgi:hypothetical protein